MAVFIPMSIWCVSGNHDRCSPPENCTCTCHTEMSPLREMFNRMRPYSDHFWQFTVDKYRRLLGEG